MAGITPRASGRRIGFDQIGPAVREWLETRFGAIEVIREHEGGMSPGCAMTFRSGTGKLLFVKAVGTELNEGTVVLFRHERRILERLPVVDYRPSLLDSFDDGSWVALVLPAVDGIFADLADDETFRSVTDIVQRQARELTPVPDGLPDLPTLGQMAGRWAQRWEDIKADPLRYLPSWAAERIKSLHNRVDRLPGRLDGDTLCHFDLRDDNILIDQLGRPVILDCGVARRGPAWADLAMIAWQRPSPKDADSWLRHLVPERDQETVTDLLVTFGGSQCWNAAQDDRPGLPNFADYCREDAQRLLAVAALRLGIGHTSA